MSFSLCDLNDGVVCGLNDFKLNFRSAPLKLSENLDILYVAPSMTLCIISIH